MVGLVNKIKRFLKFLIRLEWYDLIYNWGALCINQVNILKTWSIKGRIYLRNHGTLFIGANLRINSGRDYNVIGGDTRTNILVGEKASLHIGNNVAISNTTIVCKDSIIIEDNVLIGGGCKIYDTDFHSLNYEERVKPYLTNFSQKDMKVHSSPIIIRKGAWIGGHCIILKGVVVGENAVIGAGSVVTKSVKDNEIWGGNPARFIKNNIVN